MPTVLKKGPYRFFFYAGDREEPPHIHVEREDYEAKFWLEPVRLEKCLGFNRKEVVKLEKLVEIHRDELLRSWHAYFNG